MNMNFRLGGAAAPFAHLLGLGKRGETAAARQGMRAENDDDKEKAKAAARAQEDDERDEEEVEEEEEGETDDGEEVEEDEEESKRKGKAKGKAKGKGKGRRAEDDDKDKDAGVDGEGDDTDEEMRGHGALAQARRRERARCKAIFAVDAAGERPDIAASVAFDTALPRGEAIAVLTAAAAGQPSRVPRLADRMAEVKVAHVGPDADAKAPDHLTPTAAAIIAAGERARGR